MKAQSLGEYVLVISIVSMVVMVMFPLAKRGTQSLIKVSADQIGLQKNSEQDFSNDIGGYTEYVNSSTQTQSEISRQDRPGVIETDSSINSITDTTSLTNMGFTKE